jgi:hypothetical protein
MLRLLAICTMTFFAATANAATIVYKSDAQKIYIVGKIVPGDFQRFISALKSSRGNVTSVDIISTGGSVQEATDIGHLIRKLSLGTNVPSQPRYAPQARAMMCSVAASIAPSPCTCVSACLLIYAAGVARSGNDIHIHRIKFDDNYYGNLSPEQAQIQYRQAMQLYHNYLKEMEIPDSIFERLASMPSFATELLDWQTVNKLTWPPSFAEWLFARCGSPNAQECLINQQFDAARAAVRAYIAQQ